MGAFGGRDVRLDRRGRRILAGMVERGTRELLRRVHCFAAKVN